MFQKFHAAELLVLLDRFAVDHFVVDRSAVDRSAVDRFAVVFNESTGAHADL